MKIFTIMFNTWNNLYKLHKKSLTLNLQRGIFLTSVVKLKR